MHGSETQLKTKSRQRVALGLGLMVLLAACGGPVRPEPRPQPSSAPPVATEPERPDPPRSARGTWVVRHLIRTPGGVAQVVREARAAGLDRLIVQVRGRGDAYYSSTREPRGTGITPGFDPLRAILDEATPHGIEVHAWVNLLLVGSGPHPPTDPQHLAVRAPGWLDWTRGQARSPGSARAVPALFAAAHEDPLVEGVYLDPSNPSVRSELLALCTDLVARYAVAGLHFDYIRYGGPQHGFGAHSMRRFGGSLEGGVERAGRDRSAFDAWRRAQLDDLVEGLSGGLRRMRPNLVLSAAVKADPADARRHFGQDWAKWLKEGWLDAVAPMNYAESRAGFERVFSRLPRNQRYWMGIGAWRLSAAENLDRVRWSEAQPGVEAVLIFSHQTLRDQASLAAALVEQPRR